jgi:hypothetical protein
MTRIGVARVHPGQLQSLEDWFAQLTYRPLTALMLMTLLLVFTFAYAL